MGEKKEPDKMDIDEYLKKNFMPKDIFDITDRQMEGLYTQAYNFYQSGRYQDAMQIFRMLTTLNANESKYILGLAACMHMMKDFKSAIDNYTVCCLLDPESPVPFYHMADCFLETKDELSALMALDMAIKKAGNKPEFQILKDRASMAHKNLQNEIKEQIKT